MMGISWSRRRHLAREVHPQVPLARSLKVLSPWTVVKLCSVSVIVSPMCSLLCQFEIEKVSVDETRECCGSIVQQVQEPVVVSQTTSARTVEGAGAHHDVVDLVEGAIFSAT